MVCNAPTYWRAPTCVHDGDGTLNAEGSDPRWIRRRPRSTRRELTFPLLRATGSMAGNGSSLLGHGVSAPPQSSNELGLCPRHLASQVGVG